MQLRDTRRMKSISAFLQLVVLIFVLAVFAPPVLADSTDSAQSDLLVQSVPVSKNNYTSHSTVAVLASIKSDFLGIVVSISGLFLFGRSISLLAERQQIRPQVTAIPAEVPPLRSSSHRVTTF